MRSRVFASAILTAIRMHEPQDSPWGEDFWKGVRLDETLCILWSLVQGEAVSAIEHV